MAAAAPATGERRWAIALHGGAGVINRTDPAWLRATAEGLEAALDAGVQVLGAGGSALDAVTAAVVSLEDNPCFNAGVGSVLTRGGTHELEASVMTGDRRCGAVALLARVRNPVLLARAVMEETPHTFLAGPPAEAFAAQQGLAMVEGNAAFTTAERLAQWERWKGALAAHDDIIQQGAAAAPAAPAPAAAAPPPLAPRRGAPGDGEDEHADRAQTVGAVALDAGGRLAAATSTGGRCGKWEGRVGDTPVIGAGNWADANVALSGTGVGEEFQRRAACHDVAARVAYGGATLRDAAREVVFGDMAPGDGGFVGVDRGGAVVMEFNSKGMARAAADWTGLREVAIFPEGGGEEEEAAAAGG